MTVEESAKLVKRVAELEKLVKFYEEQFRLAQHRRFGASSEKSKYDGESAQISFFNEAEATADDNVVEPELVEIARHYRKQKRTAEDRLPDDLPVEVIEHDLSESERICPECDGKLHVMGRETRRELKIVPAKCVIVEHVRKVYACRDCERDAYGVPIIKAPIDNPVIKGSFASPEAVAHIMCQKFVMAVPLYRQEQDWNRRGINLSRQTMGNWLLRATEDWLAPIYEGLREILCMQKVLHGDETTLQVLREPGKSPQSKSYMWLYRTSGCANNPIVLFEYQPNRRAKHPEEFLKKFTGYLHADGYEGYHRLSENITVVGCFAHARRKWDEALKGLSEKEQEGSDALIGKRYCDKLFALERAFTDLSPQERHEKRLEKSKPVLDAFHKWLESLDRPNKTALGKAIGYNLAQWKYLIRYLDDGRLEISNNRAERSIKPFVISRKNFLFANTPRGAKASAIMFSLIETAKGNGLDPFAYLSYIFNRAPNLDIHNNPDYLDLLLPWSVPDFCKAQATA